MIEFGKTLRAAREAKGLAQTDIAQKTHMMIQTVEGLENEDFSRIVAPIYGRGFVKLYCEVVGLEPKPMIDAFMELYSGKHEERQTSATPPPAAPAAPAPAPAAPVAPPKADDDLFQPQTVPAKPRPEQSLSRYAGNLPSETEPGFALPSFNVNWRLVTLAAGAIAVLLLAFLAIRTVYRATMTAPEEYEQEQAQEESVHAETPVQAEEPAQAKTPRKPLPLKPFYIDSDHSTENQQERNK